MQITIIGTGKMAEAIIGGLESYHDIRLLGRDEQQLQNLQAQYPKIDAVDVLEVGCQIEGENIILCVKPYALESVGLLVSGEAASLLSVLAGTSLATLKAHIPAKSYVRTMPNLAAKHQKSMTTLYGDVDFKEEALEICQGFGDVLWLDKEHEIDIATAVAGSGPAFLALVAEALSDGAVKEGLKREDAKVLVAGLFDGFSSLLKQGHPAIIKDEVMSPAGTTAAGYAALEEACVRDGFIKAVQAAHEKAKG